MTTEKIVTKRAELDKELFILEKDFELARRKIDKKFDALYKQCPHKNMDGCSYTRWCKDCGYSEDTT